MKIVSLTQREDIGGFHSLEVITIDDIYYCPHTLTNENASTFTYNKGYSDAVEIMPVGETLLVSSDTSKTSSGRLVTITANFEVLFLDPEVDTIFNKFQHKKVIIKANKYNGTSILYGSQRYPLTFFYDIINSKKTESPSKYECKITGKISQKPVIYIP